MTISSALIPGLTTSLLYEAGMNYYYIDFENVKTAGLKGIENLPQVDTVKIFAKGGSDQMKFNDIRNLMAAKATVGIEDVVTGTKNALDFQLLTDLMVDCVKRAGMSPAPKFVIIAADHGYDPAIVQMKKRGINNVFRAVSIKEAENGNFCASQQGSKPQKQAPKNTGKKAEEPKPKAEQPKSEQPKNEQPAKKAVKQEDKSSSKPSVRRVHSRTINKTAKGNKDSTNN